jgi:uncharacterized protein YjeT (DUF2065 family)
MKPRSLDRVAVWPPIAPRTVMINLLASGTVILAGIYLVSLAAVALTAPNLATRFLMGHASSAAFHFLELLIRMAVGVAFLLHGPSTGFSNFFSAFGWVLVATTTVLFLVPWQWHKRFAQRSVPQATRYRCLIGVASFAFGAFVLAAALSKTP